MCVKTFDVTFDWKLIGSDRFTQTFNCFPNVEAAKAAFFDFWQITEEHCEFLTVVAKENE